MNAMTKVKAERQVSDTRALRTQLADAKLEAHRNRCIAARLIRSMEALCNRVEGKGVDTSHFRQLASQSAGGLA